MKDILQLTRPSGNAMTVGARAVALMLFNVIAAALLLAIAHTQIAWAAFSYEGPIDTSWYSDTQDTFTLTTEAQLAGLSFLVSQDKVTFEGKTVMLGSDVDISSYSWEPIGDPYVSNRSFQGTFDGMGHTISGLSIRNEEMNQALFGRVHGATIKNLTVRGTVICSQGGAGIISYAESSQLSNLVNYVDVSSAGSIPSYNDEKSYNGNASGVVCYSVGLTRDEESVYENLINYGSIRATSSDGVGGAVGFLAAAEGYTFRLIGCENHGSLYISSAENVEGLASGAGGVLGATSQGGTFLLTGCANTGDIVASNLGSVGGVAGSVQGVNSQIDHSSNTGGITNLGTAIDAPTNDTPTAAGVVSQFESAGGSVSNNYSSGSVSSATGYSAAIIGATTQDISRIASNNYYLEDSSTGAFNDQATGESSDRLLTGSSATAEELEALTDSENGGVTDIDYSQYKFVELDEPEEPKAIEPEVAQPFADVPWAMLAMIGLVLGVMAIGSGYEWLRFRRACETGRLA